MAWYDWFSHVYDSSLEKYYREHRELAAEALAPAPGSVVLDLPCGTGQSFEALSRRLGSGGTLVGVDRSDGMLRMARARVERAGWKHVRLVAASAEVIPPAAFGDRAQEATPIDALHVFLGMSVFTDMEATFGHLWSRLRPAGRCVLVDVYTQRLGLQGWLVNRIARAEIRRRFWEPLERRAHSFERIELPFRREHGGQIMMAMGTKPPEVPAIHGI